MLVAQAAGISTPVTVYCAAIYFYVRVLHALVHISGLSAGFMVLPTDTQLVDHAWRRIGLNLTGDSSKRQIYLPNAFVAAEGFQLLSILHAPQLH